MSRRVVVVLAAVAIAVVFAPSSPDPDPEPTPAIEIHRVASASYVEPTDQKLFTALIIGSDVREGNPSRGRADSLHLLVVNAKKGVGTLVGIPRDSYVNVPGQGPDKINASLYFGGPERTVAAVKRLSGIHIQYWALIEFSRFRKLVDTLGGVEVDVPYPMRDSFSGTNFTPGKRKMNGIEALAFARDRHSAPGGDFGRSENQGRLLVAALRKFHHDAKNPLSLAKYLRAFDDLVESDVGFRELLDLARIGRTLDPYGIRNVVIPGRTGSAGGASVVFPSGGEIFDKIRKDAVL